MSDDWSERLVRAHAAEQTEAAEAAARDYVSQLRGEPEQLVTRRTMPTEKWAADILEDRLRRRDSGGELLLCVHLGPGVMTVVPAYTPAMVCQRCIDTISRDNAGRSCARCGATETGHTTFVTIGVNIVVGDLCPECRRSVESQGS